MLPDVPFRGFRRLSRGIWLLLSFAGSVLPPLNSQTPGSRILYRVLFIVDASGSMAETWGGTPKYQIALRTLASVMDSFHRAGIPLQYALRLVGHQFPRSAHNCQDTRLELPFGRHSPEDVLELARKFTPQGWTPLAYALEQSLTDFEQASPPPRGYTVLNSIVLITDGKETCEGDPCQAIQELVRRRISLRPFVIGMGAGDTLQKYYQCMAGFLPANSKQALHSALQTVMEQVMNETTCQVFLLNAENQPRVTDVPFSLVDAFSGEIVASYVHRLAKSGVPDTISVDPRGTYWLVVHTVPPIVRKNIIFSPGKHHIVSVPVLMGILRVEIQGAREPVSVLIRESSSGTPLLLTESGRDIPLLAGTYTVEVLTTPPVIYPDVQVYGGTRRIFRLPSPGKITLTPEQDYHTVLYLVQNQKFQFVNMEILPARIPREYRLMPGKYLLIYRPVHAWKMEESRFRWLEIRSGSAQTLRF